MARSAGLRSPGVAARPGGFNAAMQGWEKVEKMTRTKRNDAEEQQKNRNEKVQLGEWMRGIPIEATRWVDGSQG
jgi:hypothetical protein